MDAIAERAIRIQCLKTEQSALDARYWLATALSPQVAYILADPGNSSPRGAQAPRMEGFDYDGRKPAKWLLERSEAYECQGSDLDDGPHR
jgi:hypothetical protein